MKYSSKQKLAMAMAAGMVVSMAPAMAFAAEIDFVKTATELGNEPAADRADLTKINTVAAKDVLAKAKAVVNGDANAQALVDAYEASIEVYEAFVAKDKTAFKNAVDKFNVNSAKVKAYLADAKNYTDGLGHAYSRFADWETALNAPVGDMTAVAKKAMFGVTVNVTAVSNPAIVKFMVYKVDGVTVALAGPQPINSETTAFFENIDKEKELIFVGLDASDKEVSRQNVQITE